MFLTIFKRARRSGRFGRSFELYRLDLFGQCLKVNFWVLCLSTAQDFLFFFENFVFYAFISHLSNFEAIVTS